MDPIRRHLLTVAGLFVATRAFANDQQGATMPPSPVKPRHVLCFLGKDERLLQPPKALARTIADFDFEIDRTHSQARPDANMARSFGVCWDRVFPKAWTASDEAAVANHKSVLYVLSPPMAQQKTAAYSAAALQIVDEMFDAGAVAAKGESAGIAHGVARWRALMDQARKGSINSQGLRMTPAVTKACRLAFAKRPLAGDRYYETVGYHLVGLPEVYVATSRGSDRDAVKLMDEIADAMNEHGIETTLRDRKLTLSREQDYAEGDFKFNPYGIVRIDA
ncbi:MULTISPECIES: hypothetical protein [Bradyrhizobium]|jgi:hypothetical protein|uniref:hypothetical protein n=1 Tax=Bradyrhizobium TaxID=374 RepID=UPI00293EDDE5|nr:hypothetical protein [Bradyrhizobium sp. NDS-1]WOH71790.1 hypothetical protein RX330_26355 [Bradyrhizobium sp. NDS-1]